MYVNHFSIPTNNCIKIKAHIGPHQNDLSTYSSDIIAILDWKNNTDVTPATKYIGIYMQFALSPCSSL